MADPDFPEPDFPNRDFPFLSPALRAGMILIVMLIGKHHISKEINHFFTQPGGMLFQVTQKGP